MGSFVPAEERRAAKLVVTPFSCSILRSVWGHAFSWQLMRSSEMKNSSQFVMGLLSVSIVLMFRKKVNYNKLSVSLFVQ